ncbi:Norsolorinic acid ketoreductase, partial [Tolypocladium ophioglossoides CBS 100239]
SEARLANHVPLGRLHLPNAHKSQRRRSPASSTLTPQRIPRNLSSTAESDLHATSIPKTSAMADNIAYLITGANKGIGKQMVTDLLLRPATTVVATVRNPSHSTAQSLHDIPTADGSKLVILPLDDKVEAIGYSSLQSRLEERGVYHLDVVVANAGTPGGYDGTLNTKTDSALDCFQVNSIGPLQLFQACWPLLDNSDSADPARKKFVLVTSSVGSIEGLERENFPAVAYGMSKAAANWLTKNISVEFKNKGLKVGIIHPGWVQTGMGQTLADAVGVKEPPMKVGDSAHHVIEQIDKLSFETTHGRFISFDGQPLPW